MVNANVKSGQDDTDNENSYSAVNADTGGCQHNLQRTETFQF